MDPFDSEIASQLIEVDHIFDSRKTQLTRYSTSYSLSQKILENPNK